jgi:peptide/nickel transport system substrate-binding protein
MLKHKRLIISCLMVASLALVIASCGPAATPASETEALPEATAAPSEPEATSAVSEEAPAEPVTIRFGWKGEPDCMTNIYTCGTIYELSELIWEGTMALGPDCVPLVPRQAKSVDVTNDGKTFTFHLWEGMTWSDGEPFTAEDMKQHWDWIQDKSIADWYWLTSKAVDWRVIDDLTFELTLSVPESSFLTGYTIWNFVLPPQVYGDMTEEDLFMYSTDTPVTTGPYKLVEWQRGSYMVFDARPEYYRGKPPIDRIVVQFYSNEDAMVNALLSGDIDVIAHNISPQYYDAVASDPDLTMWEQPPGRILHLDFNLRENVEGFDKNPAIMDPIVREAIDYSIDKQQIIDIALLGHGYICPTAFTCGPLFQHLVEPDIEVLPQDFEKANQLLDDAGYLDTDGDGVRENPDGIPMTISLYFDVANPPSLPAAQMLEEWASEIGIDLEPEGMEYATLMNRQVFTGEYEMAIRSWMAEFEPAVMRDLYSCDAGMPFTGWCSEAFDEANSAIQMAFGPERDQYRHDMNLAFHDERPYIYLAGVQSLGAFRHDKVELPVDSCPYYGGLLSWYSVMNAEVK